MNTPTQKTYAGTLGFVPQPPLPHWSARDGGSQENVYRGPSSGLPDFIAQMVTSGATSVRSMSNNGKFATVAVSYAAWQDGASNTTSTLPDGQWSISPGGLTQHIFKDARFAALDSNVQKYLDNRRQDAARWTNFQAEEVYIDAFGGTDGAGFKRCLLEQKDTQEADAIVVTRRVRVRPGFTGTVGWSNVGKVFEDNATFQAEAAVPDAIIDEFDRDYQWLVRPFTKEQQGDGSYVYLLTFWGAPEWDDFLYPNRV